MGVKIEELVKHIELVIKNYNKSMKESKNNNFDIAEYYFMGKIRAYEDILAKIKSKWR